MKRLRTDSSGAFILRLAGLSIFKLSRILSLALADEQTQYQHIQFVETEFFGNAMILDGIIQLTERDNMGYHEMIVHVPMLAVGKPQRVLIVGGGDGGALQQVLRYPSVKEAAKCSRDKSTTR